MLDNRGRLTLCVIGDSSSGKSMTAGHLVYKLGKVKEQIVNQYQKVVQELGQGNMYQWIMHQHKREKEIGMSIDFILGNFKTNKLDVTIMDVPGHQELMKNMIAGTSTGDCALLVVTADTQYEAQFSVQGQIKSHCAIAFTLGIKQMIVCVNKMDSTIEKWSEVRYQQIVAELSEYLYRVGYRANSLKFVPISAALDENMFTKSDNMKWYDGPTLLDAIDTLIQPKGYAEKPLRISILNIYKQSHVIEGKVESGTIKIGMMINITQANKQGIVTSIEMHHIPIDKGTAGDIIGFKLQDVPLNIVKRGMICSDGEKETAKLCQSFVAQIVVLECPGKIKNGYTPQVSISTGGAPCKFDKILAKIERITGKTLQEAPESIQSGETAMVKMIPQQPICVEQYTDCHALGRFIVRANKRVVAVGIVKSVIKKA